MTKTFQDKTVTQAQRATNSDFMELEDRFLQEDKMGRAHKCI